MNDYLKNVESELWLVLFMAVALFHLLLFVLNKLARASNKYFTSGYVVVLSVYMGFFKIKVHDMQVGPKNIVIFLVMLYMFCLTYMFGYRYLISRRKVTGWDEKSKL